MKLLVFTVFFVALALISCQPKPNPSQAISASTSEDKIWHYSLMDAMRQGIYQGEFTIKDLRQKGDLGLGTYNNLDGELVALDGNFYRIAPSGKVELAADERRSPFTALTFFKPDSTLRFTFSGSFEALKDTLLHVLPTQNVPFALKVTTQWADLVVGGAEPIAPNDTTGLAVLMETRPAYKANAISGTMVGYYTPPLMSTLDLSPFHFHFLSEDKTFAGHLMSGHVNRVQVTIYWDEKSGYDIDLLHHNERFRHINLERKAASATY